MQSAVVNILYNLPTNNGGIAMCVEGLNSRPFLSH